MQKRYMNCSLFARILADMAFEKIKGKMRQIPHFSLLLQRFSCLRIGQRKVCGGKTGLRHAIG